MIVAVFSQIDKMISMTEHMNILYKASLKKEAKEYFASLTYICVYINIQHRGPLRVQIQSNQFPVTVG